MDERPPDPIVVEITHEIDLHTFPWRTLNWIAIRHDAHHIDMHKGNYATITLLYDWLFGTLETHPLELTAGTSSDRDQQGSGV